MVTPRRLIGAVVLLGLIVVVALTAGSSHGPRRATAPPASTTAPPASTTSLPPSPDPGRQRFLSAANAICVRLDQQARAAAPQGNDLPSYAQGLPRLATALDQARSDLSALQPPPDGRTVLANYEALLTRQAASARAAAAAAADNDNAGFQRAMQGLLTGQEQPGGSMPAEMQAAAGYGMTACAQ